MNNKSGVATWIISRCLVLGAAVTLTACTTGGTGDGYDYSSASTPTVDYVENLDVYSAPHRDSFLNQLAMNYRSYAIYNARTSGYPDIGERFAQKAVSAFSGEIPFPESLDYWPIDGQAESYELYTAYNELMTELKNDATDTHPELAAEAQAKFDCWLSAAASGQTATARECRTRYNKTMTALRDCHGGKIVQKAEVATPVPVVATRPAQTYYPDTRSMSVMRGSSAREGVIIVNNVNVPEHLINPVPVPNQQPMIFNQNIYGGDKTVTNTSNRTGCARVVETAQRECPNRPAVECPAARQIAQTTGCPCAQVARVAQAQCPDMPVSECPAAQQVAQSTGCTKIMIEPQPASPDITKIVIEPESQPTPDYVTRQEFIDMMMAMRSELAAINARLDKLQANQKSGDKTMIKVQQIPLEPKQHVMEEIFEIHFDFDKAVIKPEYEDLIQKLAAATQSNRNIKVSVIGHTDTAGSKSYNYALGGRRAEAVRKMLVQYGIPSSQIVAVSSGEEDLKVQTPDNTPNAQNRRVRVIKETHYSEESAATGVPVTIDVSEMPVENCGEFGCE